MLVLRIICAALFILLSVVCWQPGYCAEVAEGQEVLTASGKVVALDWVGSTVTIRINFLGGIHDELTFQVSRDTKLTKGGRSLSLGELQIQDRVNIEYFNKRFQGLEAIHIMVLT